MNGYISSERQRTEHENTRTRTRAENMNKKTIKAIHMPSKKQDKHPPWWSLCEPIFSGTRGTHATDQTKCCLSVKISSSRCGRVPWTASLLGANLFAMYPGCRKRQVGSSPQKAWRHLAWDIPGVYEYIRLAVASTCYIPEGRKTANYPRGWMPWVDGRMDGLISRRLTTALSTMYCHRWRWWPYALRSAYSLSLGRSFWLRGIDT